MSNRYIISIIVSSLIVPAYSISTHLPVNQHDLQDITSTGNLRDANRIILPSRNAQSLPILAPIFKNRGINISIDWGEGEYIEYHNISDFSSEIALTFWKSSEEILVVNSYQNALLASPIASIKDIPILFYGDTTQSTIDALNCDFIIEIGDTPVEGNLFLENQSKIVKYTIDVADLEGISIDYITIVNPDDQDTQVLSAFGSLLVAYRNGILCTSSNDTECINRTIKEAIEMLYENGMNAKYICLVGNPESIPFNMVKVNVSGIEEKNIATDNFYGDLDGNPLVPELAIGRFLSRDLSDASALFDRYVNYQYYFHDRVIKKLNWQLRALSWVHPLELFSPCFYGLMISVFSIKKTFSNCGFITRAFTTKLRFVVEKSNYIFLCTHGGNPYNIPTIHEEHWVLNPCVIFMVSCSGGRTDNLILNKTVTCRFIHNGTAAYIAPTRTTFVGWMYSPKIQDWFGNLLGRLFFEEIVENRTVGDALMNAKYKYYKASKLYGNWGGEADRLILYEFVLYGDPAFNPYEPCSECLSREHISLPF